MAVLSKDKQRPHQGELAPRHVKLAGYTNFGGGTTAHTVYKGSAVVCDVSDTDGYGRAAPLTSSTNAASGDMLLGVSLEQQAVTSTNTADGSVKCLVATKGIWGFAVGSLAITDIGAIAYFSDDDTVTTTSTNNFYAGRIVDVDATYVYVDIEPYVRVPL